MTSRLSALLVWGLAGATAVFWALRLFGSPTPIPAQASLAASSAPLAGDLSRLLGAAPVAPGAPRPVAPDVAGRFKLTGVVATRAARDPSGPAAPGLALIAVDGKPPRAYRVGDALDDTLVLQSVGLRSARIGTAGGAAALVLELPRPTPAATGVPGGVVVPVVNVATPPGVAPRSSPEAPPPIPGSSLPSPVMPPIPMPAVGEADGSAIPEGNREALR